MTCDELFNLLTEEAGAEGNARQEMKRHLEGCRSCSRLADALEPALGLFRESTTDEGTAYSSPSDLWSDSDQEDPQWFLPARGFDDPEDRSNPGCASSRRSTPDSPWLTQILGGDLLRIAVALLVGLTVGALLWSQDKTLPGGSALASLSAPGESAGRGAAPRVTLASLLLTSACLPAEHRDASAVAAQRIRPAGELLAAADLGALNCCTLCHTSQGTMPPSKTATLHVIQSCQACHTF